jgi:hypothetical protein
MNGARFRSRNTAETPAAVRRDNQHTVHEGTIHTNAAGMKRKSE